MLVGVAGCASRGMSSDKSDHVSGDDEAADNDREHAGRDQCQPFSMKPLMGSPYMRRSSAVRKKRAPRVMSESTVKASRS